jgi:hypothetical protein
MANSNCRDLCWGTRLGSDCSLCDSDFLSYGCLCGDDLLSDSGLSNCLGRLCSNDGLLLGDGCNAGCENRNRFDCGDGRILNNSSGNCLECRDWLVVNANPCCRLELAIENALTNVVDLLCGETRGRASVASAMSC